MHSIHLLVSNKVESIFLLHSLGCRALKKNLQKRWKLDLLALELRIKWLSRWKHCLPKPACHVDLWYLISGLTWEHFNGFEDDVWGGGYQQHISGFVWALLPKHQVYIINPTLYLTCLAWFSAIVYLGGVQIVRTANFRDFRPPPPMYIK